MLDVLSIGISQALLLLPAVLCFAAGYRLLGFPDLTVDGSFGVGGAVFAVCMTRNQPVAVALSAGAAAGFCAGAATGIIHTRLGVNPFLSGIIVVAMLYSVTLHVMGGSNVSLLGLPSPLDGALRWLGFGDALVGLAVVAFLMLAGANLSLQSSWGIRMRAVGSNPDMANGLGISRELVLPVGLGCTNALAAVAGCFMVDRQNFADVSSGQGMVLTALAAYAIGERILSSRTISFPTFVLGASVIGTTLYFVLWSIALRLGVPATDLKLTTGLIVLLVIVTRRQNSSLSALTNDITGRG
ncbi:MAG TPA: hypothetical protein VGD01_10590 [Candidatus Elarobacter sp.]|jgi:putative ABC transport system permease protein